jgi:phosphopantothenoylcysteine decarboxylase/phosphopantothenate--cysteine ligase
MACCRYFEAVDIAVFAAAVADYRPEWISTRKIKKNEKSFALKMTKNIDIAHEFGRYKRPDQFSVGFALETNDEVYHAQGKLTAKNFDMVVLNSTNDENAGFGHDTNKVHLIKKDFSSIRFPLKPKTEVASDIVHEIALMIRNPIHFMQFAEQY